MWDFLTTFLSVFRLDYLEGLGNPKGRTVHVEIKVLLMSIK